MKILVIGGTRFFGIPMVERLIRDGEDVTIATRGLAKDAFGDKVNRIKLDLNDENSVRSALHGKKYDVVIDKMGYCSNEMKWILESLYCDRFIHMSTAGVYDLNHLLIREEEFNPTEGELIWCGRKELSYDEVKRNAERALFQIYTDVDCVSVRVPFVLGKNDYTGRLKFYVEHVLNSIPMYVDNMDEEFCVSECNEISDMIIRLVRSDYTGTINGCSAGLISIRELLNYISIKAGKKPVLEKSGDPAPYNCTVTNSLCTEKAKELGISFRDVKSWVFDLLDEYMSCRK
ncbi:MAG: NAD-dependent epimerase/dehydratase family protein [Lachnospiraceae bacterium]|nr:NAD-dependent epimerase/dehydratase family protein [Lachnospiraceae bacterium]